MAFSKILGISMTTTQSDKKTISKLWYKNYMVWIFVIGLPVFVVIACIWFVFYSVQIKDSVVRDDWYMDGKTLYADVSKDKLAYDLGLSGKLSIDNQTVNFILNNQSPNFELPKELSVQISHATQIKKDRDFTLTLSNPSQQLYTGQVEMDKEKGKYYIMIKNPENSWRLQRVQEFPTQETIVLNPLKTFEEKR